MTGKICSKPIPVKRLSCPPSPTQEDTKSNKLVETTDKWYRLASLTHHANIFEASTRSESDSDDSVFSTDNSNRELKCQKVIADSMYHHRRSLLRLRKS